MSAPQDNPSARRRPLGCPDCDAHLELSQRYCVVCGARVRPLPHFVAATLAAMRAGRRWAIGDPLPAAAAAATPVDEPVTEPLIIRPFGRPIVLPGFQLPSPRGAAVAILGVLAFTVAVTQGISFAGNPLVILGNHNSTPLATVTPTTSTPAVTPSTSAGNTGAAVASNTGSSAPASSTGSSNSPSGTAATGATTTATTATSTGTSTTATDVELPPIKHIWMIQLGDQPYANTFSDSSTDTYLNHTLARTGELVPTFYATGTSDLANEDALISGQGPTPQIDQDCPSYDAVSPGLLLSGQAQGDGCIFNKTVPTIFSQLTALGDTWKVYVQGMGSGSDVNAARRHDPSRTRASDRHVADQRVEPQVMSSSFLTDITNLFGPSAHRVATTRVATPKRHAATTTAASCRHPAVGATDANGAVNGTDGYVTWRNPAVYFDSITGTKDCADDDVGLNTLAGDLKSSSTVPSLSLIYADPCDDGSDTGPGTACPDVADAPNAATDTTPFLEKVLAEIEASPAYKDGKGLILISFAMDAQNGSDVSDFPQASCCNDPPYPNLEAAAATTTTTTPTGSATTTTSGNTGAATTSANTGAATTSSSTGAGSTTTSSNTGAGSTTTGTTTTACTTTGTTTTSGATGAGTTTTSGTTGAGTTTTSGTTGAGTTTTSGTTGADTTTTSSCAPAATTDMYGNPITGGGGQVGLLAISKWVTKGSQDVFDTFNDFSLLASLEKLYGITTQLGYADTPGLAGIWGKAFFSEYTPGG